MRDEGSVNDQPVVFVIDDDPSVRDSIALLLLAEGFTARTFGSARGFLSSWSRAQPGCLIVDLRLPDLSGLDLQDRLAGEDGAPPIIFLTGHGTVHAAVHALKAGAVDFLEKPFEADTLLERVREALDEDRQRRSNASRLESLTRREREVLGEVVSGKANKVIGKDLGISERTVEQHRAHGMRKLGLRSVVELVQLLR